MENVALIVVILVALGAYVWMLWTAVDIAKRRGRDPLAWFAACLIFSLPALIVLVLLPPRYDSSSQSPNANDGNATSPGGNEFQNTTWFRSSAGVAVGSINDGRAVAYIDGQLRQFNSLEDYRKWANDHDLWTEISAPSESRI